LPLYKEKPEEEKELKNVIVVPGEEGKRRGSEGSN
jgi:PDZ domain-containing secreted protein